MPGTTEEQGSPGLGELSRQVRDVLVRFEGLAVKLETQFLRGDIFELYKNGIDRELRGIDNSLRHIEAEVDKRPTAELQQEKDRRLEARVHSLEDNQKWIVRLVLAFVVMGILAAVIVFRKPVGGA